MTVEARKMESLPTAFAEDLFHLMQEWSAARPTVNPLHGRDTMASHDTNFGSLVHDTNDPQNKQYVDEADEEPQPAEADFINLAKQSIST